jgi:hypothetical protein
VEFEPTISVLERAKTVRALDRSTTAIGNGEITHFLLQAYKRMAYLQVHIFQYALLASLHISSFSVFTAGINRGQK